MSNIYQPHLMTIKNVIQETPDIKTFHLVFQDDKAAENFSFETGQFAEYSAFGFGESTFCIASSPTRMDHIECCFRASGKNTNALAALSEGDTIGFRGPYGNRFPIEEWEGKDLIFIGGGIALPPLRSVIWNCLDLREQDGRYGGHDGQFDLVAGCQLEHAFGRRDPLDHRRCRSGHLVRGFAPADPFPGRSVAPDLRDTRGEQVAHTRQAPEGVRRRAHRNAEPGDLDQPPCQ